MHARSRPSSHSHHLTKSQLRLYNLLDRPQLLHKLPSRPRILPEQMLRHHRLRRATQPLFQREILKLGRLENL